MKKNCDYRIRTGAPHYQRMNSVKMSFIIRLPYFIGFNMNKINGQYSRIAFVLVEYDASEWKTQRPKPKMLDKENYIFLNFNETYWHSQAPSSPIWSAIKIQIGFSFFYIPGLKCDEKMVMPIYSNKCVDEVVFCGCRRLPHAEIVYSHPNIRLKTNVKQWPSERTHWTKKFWFNVMEILYFIN